MRRRWKEGKEGELEQAGSWAAERDLGYNCF